jgi:amino acid permease
MSFFSRQELLSDSLPARRASMVLFAIENRTAQLAAQEVRDTAVYLTLANSQAREQDFFAALARGRAQEVNVTIQQIERYAPQSKSLLPETPNAKLNAALADLLGKKYKFTRAEIPNLRAALALDDATTQRAFQTAFHKRLDSIYAPQVDFTARLRFAWARFAARLENLPPFWLAVLLTMPGAAGLLALPIALAGVGVGGGVLLLFAFALINMFTAAALAEATARAGVTRLGLGWLGQLVQEYLGGAGALFLTIILALNNFFVLVIFYLGVGGTLQDATHVPIALWMLALFAVCVFFLSRGSLNATVASMLLIVFGVLALLVVIPLFALPHFQWSNLAQTPLVSFNGNSLQFALGLLLSTYFSHLLVATYGTVIVRRDASARAWVWGSAAAILGFMLMASFWFVILNGALSPQTLAAAQGTALVPLAATLSRSNEGTGAIVLWLGSLLVILSLGLATVQIALGLSYMVQERLPAPRDASLFAKPRVRFLISLAPMAGVLLLAEWLAFTGANSFARLLGIVGAFALPLLGGVFPILLLASTRRKGEFVPRGMAALLTHPFVLTGAYVFFVGMIFAYGLFLFQDTLIRILIFGVGVATLVVTFIMFRRGAFAARLVVLLQHDERNPRAANYSIVERGQPMPARVELEYARGKQMFEMASRKIAWDGLRVLCVNVAASHAHTVKLWAIHYTNQGALQGVNARVELRNGAHTAQFVWNETRAETNAPMDARALEAQITFDKS